MKPLKLFLYVLLYAQSLTLSTFAQTGKVDSSNIVTLRIDPQSARGAAVSQIFDEVKFIPLETTKESLFGNIAQLKVAGNKLIIYDYDTKAVLLFSNEGKFITKIDAARLQTDKEDKEKAQSYGFMTVIEEGKDYIVIFTNNNAQYFTFEGKFVKKVKNFNYSDGITMADGNVTVKQFIQNKSN
ncbi:MAG: 6-bladed beta-propeller [Pedobacter sp.]|nr:MAG: 6-bladed beta-propeller [Pedobacter sp.]